MLQPTSPLKQRLDEPAKYHGVTNVADEKFIKTQELPHQRLGDLLQRVFLSCEPSIGCATLHKPMKVHPSFR